MLSLHTMTWILPFILLASGTDTPLDERFPEGTEVFHCDFGPSWDANYDDWPDQWTRQQGPGYPHYVSIGISEEPSPVGNRCLRVEIDGGAAAAFSPPIQIGLLFSYVMEGYLRTDGLEHNTAFFSLTFLDEDRHRLKTVVSERFRHTGGWQKVRIGPVAPDGGQSRFAIIGLHVEPGERDDLRGSVSFDDIWLARLPRMVLSSDQPHNLLFDSREIEIVCAASGFSRPNPVVAFRLTDALGNEVLSERRYLNVRTAELHVAVSLDTFAEGSSGLLGEARWRPELPSPGFYRVEATMQGDGALAHRRQLNIAVIESREAAPNNEFGWTLPGRGGNLPPALLGRLVRQAGIGRVKYPLWFGDGQDEREIERMVGLVERLSYSGIELVGILDKPPQLPQSMYDGRGRLGADDVFAPDPKVWYPLLEPVMARFAMRVRTWQLGTDLDTSFVDSVNPVAKLRQVKAELERIGGHVNLGMGWRWTHEVPAGASEPAPWQFLTLSAEPVLTAQELGHYLQATGQAGTQRWVALQPLPAADYATEVRATDLVARMIAAKIHGAEAVFCPEPFSDERGLMHADGTPGELFMPWRVAALALGGATYLGSVDLPNGSPNHVFERNSDAVMIVWNWNPTEEILHLGRTVRQVDLWGRETVPRSQGHRQVIDVAKVPVFVTGLDRDIARWRLNCHLANTTLPSVFAVPHRNGYSFQNTFDHGVAGRATVVTPDGWTVEPPEITFRLVEGELLEQPMAVTLPFDATTGRHPLRIDFDIQTSPSRQFSVYRHVDVGLGFVYVEMETHVNEHGELEVLQRFVNDGDGRVSFRCQLFIPGRPRMMTQVVSLARNFDEQVYRLANGSELLGETMWLRAEEMAGPRVLNYRFIATE